MDFLFSDNIAQSCIMGVRLLVAKRNLSAVYSLQRAIGR
jgi:hypothetical protein